MPRPYSAEKAILLASSNEAACEYLRKRAINPSLFDPISRETEAALLERRDRLVDLTLAECSLYPETARALFFRDTEDDPIRSLVLSNEALASQLILGRFPACLFDGEEGLLEYLAGIPPDEQYVLFSNPSLHDEFLQDFLSLGKPWKAMDEQQRLWAFDALAHNEKLRRKRSMADFDDGLAWYGAGLPFEAAWRLIERLDVSAETAKHLAALLRDLPNDCHKIEGIQGALGRWKAKDVEDRAREEEENGKGELSDFQVIRQAGARLIANSHKAEPNLFRDDEDLALRCGAYEVGRFKLDDLSKAVERDGDHARRHFLRNDQLWRSSESRIALHDILGPDEVVYWEYGRRDRYYREHFPEWFKDEDLPIEPDERPISEATIADVVAGVVSDPVTMQMSNRLAALEQQQRVLMWLIVAVLLALLLWR